MLFGYIMCPPHKTNHHVPAIFRSNDFKLQKRNFMVLFRSSTGGFKLILLLPANLHLPSTKKKTWLENSSLQPICSMVLEYLPTFTLKSPSFVGKYSSTKVRIWDLMFCWDLPFLDDCPRFPRCHRPTQPRQHLNWAPGFWQNDPVGRIWGLPYGPLIRIWDLNGQQKWWLSGISWWIVALPSITPISISIAWAQFGVPFHSESNIGFHGGLWINHPVRKKIPSLDSGLDS